MYMELTKLFTMTMKEMSESLNLALFIYSISYTDNMVIRLFCDRHFLINWWQTFFLVSFC